MPEISVTSDEPVLAEQIVPQDFEFLKSQILEMFESMLAEVPDYTGIKIERVPDLTPGTGVNRPADLAQVAFVYPDNDKYFLNQFAEPAIKAFSDHINSLARAVSSLHVYNEGVAGLKFAEIGKVISLREDLPDYPAGYNSVINCTGELPECGLVYFGDSDVTYATLGRVLVMDRKLEHTIQLGIPVMYSNFTARVPVTMYVGDLKIEKKFHAELNRDVVVFEMCLNAEIR